MKLKAKTPIVQEARAQVVFDHYWMANMTITGQPNGKTSVNARLVPAVDVTVDGVTTKKLNAGNGINLNIPDIFARIEADPTGPLAQAFGAVMAALIAEMPEIEAE